MNELKVFNYEQNEIRTVLIDGEPWWVAKDVAETLGYAETNNMVKRLDEEEFMSYKLEGMNMKSVLINESGLYTSIIGSQLPSAKQFKKWVTSEVLPSIRKNGGYINNQENLTPEQIVANALVVAQNIIENQKLQLEQLKPKAEYAEKMLKSKDNILVREFAKVLCDEGFKIGEKRLYQWLRDNLYLMKNNEPMQRYVDNNTFVVKSVPIETSFGTKQSRTTLITPQGQLYLFRKITNKPIE